MLLRIRQRQINKLVSGNMGNTYNIQEFYFIIPQAINIRKTCSKYTPKYLFYISYNFLSKKYFDFFCVLIHVTAICPRIFIVYSLNSNNQDFLDTQYAVQELDCQIYHICTTICIRGSSNIKS